MSHQSNFNASFPNNTLTPFQQSIGGALVKAAEAIVGEIGSLGAVGNAKRHTTAANILASNPGPIPYIAPTEIAYLENGGTTGDSDAQLDTGMATLWNDLSGVAHGD